MDFFKLKYYDLDWSAPKASILEILNFKAIRIKGYTKLNSTNYFSDVNPRNLRRLINIIALTGRLLSIKKIKSE
jgi:hypothetical protein